MYTFTKAGSGQYRLNFITSISSFCVNKSRSPSYFSFPCVSKNLMHKVGCNHLRPQYDDEPAIKRLPSCNKDQLSQLTVFYSKNTTLLGESEFIRTTGCVPPCTLMYNKFDPPMAKYDEDNREDEFVKRGYRLVS